MPSSDFPADDLVTLTVNVFLNKSIFQDVAHEAEKAAVALAAEQAERAVRVLVARKFEDARELAS